MVSIRDVTTKAKELKQRATGDGLGPDRGTRDQLKARKERAKIEARKEAKREQRQEKVADAREKARKRAKRGGVVGNVVEAISSAADAVDDGDNERIDDIKTAMQSYFDGDGEDLAAEFGLQSQSRAQAENQSLSALGDRVASNSEDINSLEAELGQTDPGRPESTGAADDVGLGGFGGGSEADQREEMGFDVDSDDDGGLF